jgi:hypothetical protein
MFNMIRKPFYLVAFLLCFLLSLSIVIMEGTLFLRINASFFGVLIKANHSYVVEMVKCSADIHYSPHSVYGGVHLHRVF